MIASFDPKKPVPEIVAALHKYQIPVGAIGQVFDLVLEDIEAHTVPYNPNTIREVYEVRCPHCNKDLKFGLKHSDNDLPDDLQNSPYYFAKKCDNSN